MCEVTAVVRAAPSVAGLPAYPCPSALGASTVRAPCKSQAYAAPGMPFCLPPMSFASLASVGLSG
eukprot:359063-Chlamydomonas_euryale.AAC.2